MPLDSKFVHFRCKLKYQHQPTTDVPNLLEYLCDSTIRFL